MALPIFALTIFTSAFLLFVIQPMFTRMVLPLMGGGASVWNTAVLFFQLVLVAGYLYAHVASTRLGVRRHTLVHVGFLLVSALLLPIQLRMGPPPGGADPVTRLLLTLGVSIAVPFFFLSTTGPLLQRWFVETGHRDAANPYFLYSASNAGSLLALLSYPFLIEPWLTLAGQRNAWSAGYAALILLVAACAWVVRRRGVRVPAAEARAPVDVPDGEDTTTSRDRLRWLLLAAVPSGMMLAITTFMTTDVAPIPLLWVIPLALYLLSFILVFARRPWPAHGFWVRVQPFALIGTALLLFWGRSAASPMVAPVHLLAFFVTAMVCHGELVRLRPPARGLTGFYLWMSVGGAVGGAFCAIVAPMVFNSIAEYPWLIVAACALRPGMEDRRGLRLGWPELVLLGAVVVLALATALRPATLRPPGLEGGVESAWGVLLVLLGGCLAAGVALFRLRNSPIRLAVGTGLLLLVGPTLASAMGETVHADRNFYGARSVRDDGVMVMLMHGTTNHGLQLKSAERRGEPMLYYDWRGPLADIFRLLPPPPAPVRVAVAGLGIGGISAYGRPGDTFDFYEIDPAIERMARNTEWFTYLDITPATVNVIIGDGRIELLKAEDGLYDLIILDAFSSDAIPIHLMTREAAEGYLTKLRPGGVLVFHISNRYLDLRAVMGALGESLGLGAWTSIQRPAQSGGGSTWAVIVPEAIGRRLPGTWERRPVPEGTALWTDDYSNVFSALKLD